jgi:hypothetical protein
LSDYQLKKLDGFVDTYNNYLHVIITDGKAEKSIKDEKDLIDLNRYMKIRCKNFTLAIIIYHKKEDNLPN